MVPLSSLVFLVVVVALGFKYLTTVWTCGKPRKISSMFLKLVPVAEELSTTTTG